MRIAFVHPGMDVKGGAENIIVWLADGLGRRGHDVRVFTENYKPEYWPREMTERLDVAKMPSLLFGRFGKSERLRCWERERQLARMLEGFDVAVGQHFPSYYWAIRARERAAGAWKVVWLCQEPMRRLYADVTDMHLVNFLKFAPPGSENDHLWSAAQERMRRMKRHGRRFARDARNIRWDLHASREIDLVLANSAFTALNVRQVFRTRPQVCHLGIPLPPEAEYVRGEYAAVLTTLAVRKNVPTIIRAMHRLVAVRGRKDIRLRIAGQGPDRAALDQLAAELGVGANVEFTGPLPDANLPEFFRRARVVIYVPLDEPFGLVPLEALAAKTPVVVSDHGGPAEIIEHGVTGLHVNPFDAAAIADAVEKLWDDDAKARELAEAGCRRVREYYSLEAFVSRFETALEGMGARRESVIADGPKASAAHGA